jgi:exosortase E/protease (VPEID-CTERM system)
VGFAALFLAFGYLRRRAALDRISVRIARAPVGRGLLAGHFLAMAAYAAICWALYEDHLPALFADLIAPILLVVGVSGIALAAFALIPLVLWVRLIRDTGWLWAYTLLALILARVARGYSQSLWNWQPVTQLTFLLSKAFLSPFVSATIADPATRSLGTPKFTVEIAPTCSGIEGAGLMLLFGVLWLWLFRREYRFPQALILIPAGVATIFLLNAVRITALILIGDAGAPQIAVGGFHSQAGWFAFNAVALAFAVGARRIPWVTIRQHTGQGIADRSSDNPTATYLMPFLSILAIGMVTAAASGDFEWLYPMRFLAAAVTLWILRKRYAALDWKFDWFGPAMGVLVFAVWIAIDAYLNATPNDAMPHSLADSSTPIRAIWIVFRALSAIVTVPIAEELAFRGFLLRRLISPDFEALPMSKFTWLGLAISSTAFGLLHGNLWFAGILAGLLYAWALIRRGRIGEAVVAHATTNALLAGYVLIFQKWHLWS